MKIIVDTNILISVLVASKSFYRNLLLSESDVLNFYVPNYTFLEIFSHKERFQKSSKLDDAEIQKLLHQILENVHFVNERLISIKNNFEAYHLCKDIDKDDIPFVALTLELEGKLWTKDDRLKEGLKAKGFDQFFEP